MLQGSHIHVQTHVMYKVDINRRSHYIISLLGLHPHNVTISLPWDSNQGHFGGIWVFLVIVSTSLSYSLCNIITIFPSHLF